MYVICYRHIKTHMGRTFSRLRQYMLRNDFQGHAIPIYSYVYIIEIAIHSSLAGTPIKFVVEKLHENN